MDMSDISDQTNDLFFLWFCKNPPFKRNRHGRIFEKAGRFGKFFLSIPSESLYTLHQDPYEQSDRIYYF